MFIKQMCCYKNIIIDNIQKYTERDFLEIHTLAAAEMGPLDTLFRYYLLLIIIIAIIIINDKDSNHDNNKHYCFFSYQRTSYAMLCCWCLPINRICPMPCQSLK